MIRRALSCFALGSVLALAACSSSDGGASPQGVMPQAFAKYCTGTLKVDEKLMKPMGAGSWIGDGSQHAGAGTTFLVSPDNGKWSGYVPMNDGTIDKVDADFFKGLVKDTDFSSDCATDAALDPFAKNPRVVLATSNVYASNGMSGQACTLDAGTTMTNFSYFYGGGSGPASVSSDEIKAKCGYDLGYTKDMEYAELIAKP